MILWYSQIKMNDVALVGGKNASLGEMWHQLQPQGIQIPDGFATTAEAFNLFLSENRLETPLKHCMAQLNTQYSNLTDVSAEARKLMLAGKLPERLKTAIVGAYRRLCELSGRQVDVAVRSSATAEDLPDASFAGQHDSFLNICGEDAVLDAVHRCFASLYNARAIKYRTDHGYHHSKVALSAGIQYMVRADLAASGVCFTIDPESGFSRVIVITACWGLGENIVQGVITPDEYHVFKEHLGRASRCIISKKPGSKQKTMVYREDASGTINIDTPAEKQKQFAISDSEIERLAQWALKIEQHYRMPMDIEWAKDGISGQLFIVQARPETVHGAKDPLMVSEFRLREKGRLIVSGNAVGSGITSGIARKLASPAEAAKLKEGEVLVTEITNPDWDPYMKKAAAIITTKGGRTSHAAIVARELGALAIVGAEGATSLIKDGEQITIDNSTGKIGTVYEGRLAWDEKQLDFRHLQLPITRPMLILADPDKAYKYSFYPSQGVGLMRMEFVITGAIRVHPMALVHFDQISDASVRHEIESLTMQYADKKAYFVDQLSQAIGTIAAAFYPREVIVRMSDFKSNEYADLIGGAQFEVPEENPMIGFRGASRYYNDRYKEGFKLECEAIKVVRNEMGLDNVKLMIPFCRTVEEGKKVVALMEEYGLERGESGLEIYVMAEIPSNVIMAEEFAKVFDGFSIGSNDLTQLTLGIDRDSAIISHLFDENDAAVKAMITRVVETAKRCGSKIGLCGQAPSDDPAFAGFLIRLGIDSISFNPDALLKGIENMLKAESEQNNQT
jgi:pyruvate,water dikinase